MPSVIFYIKASIINYTRVTNMWRLKLRYKMTDIKLKKLTRGIEVIYV